MNKKNGRQRRMSDAHFLARLRLSVRAREGDPTAVRQWAKVTAGTTAMLRPRNLYVSPARAAARRSRIRQHESNAAQLAYDILMDRAR